jgi:hypothetical protein
VTGALALAACGGATADSDESGVVIEDRLAAVAASTIDAGSARMSMTMTVPGVDHASLTADGITDFASGNSQMTMDMGALMGLAGAGDALGGGDFTVEMRMVDGVVYMRYPEMMSQFLGGKPWISIDATAALGTENPGMTGPLGQADPTKFLEYLATVSSGVEETGRETVRDVETTKYHAVIDFEKAVEQVAPETFEMLGVEPNELADELAQMQSVIGAELPVDVWVDDDGLLRRMRMEMTIEGQSATVDMEMFDYGVDVAVEAPPADEVGDMSSLLGGVGSAFGSGEVAA